MCALFRKTTALERRRRNLERELALLDNDIKSLSKVVKDPRQADKTKLRYHDAHLPKEEAAASNTAMPELSKGPVTQQHEERFAEYLSGEFQTIGSLKNEKKLQRNKAVVMVIVVLVVVVWMWRTFF